MNTRVRLWSLPIIAVALLGLTSLLLGTAYPAFVQRFRVEPQELDREREYIVQNIAATRRAFALDTVDDRAAPVVTTAVTPEELAEHAATIANVRLWRPTILQESFEAEQRLKPYYVFNDVDVDRYSVGGQPRVLMVAAREVSQEGIPGGGSWQSRHLVYTHGYGIVAAQVNEADPEGGPLYTIEDIPPDPSGVPFPTQPRIYYGEEEPEPFVVVKTRTDELDFEGQPSAFSYDGEGGIELSNIFVRAMFAWRFRDVNLLISGQIDANSTIMIRRSIIDRATRAVPFLGFDSDPYLAVVDGQPMWIWDAYTTTTEYPYSQAIDLGQATGGGPQTVPSGVTVNYLRNSVKVTVDAYDGTVTYYADLDEPIVQAWDNAFPDLFENIDTAPASLREHFRYPENLFQVQATQFARYHVQDPTRFFNRQDFWQVADDPTNLPTDTTTTVDEPLPDLRPYYLLLQLPGDTAERFQLVVPFVPAVGETQAGAVPNMVAWMAANSDPEGYGDVVALTLPAGRNVDSPALVFSRIRADTRFAADQTLLSQQGSRVIFGDLLVIPVGDAFLYVLPVYVRSTQGSAVPELKRVVVVNGVTVGLGNTFADALDSAVLGGEAPPPPPDGEPTPPDGPQDLEGLLAEALDHFAAAERALREGDLATYERELALAQDLVEQAQTLLTDQTAPTEPSPSP